MNASRLARVRRSHLSLSVLVLLAACGGSSSPALTGAVIDGYIEGAKVCLDVNGNGACDAGEPYDTTDSQGRYTLRVGATPTDGLKLIAEVPASAKDADDGGKTLAEAGKSAYTLATVAEQPAVLTPLTTLMVGKVETDKITLAQAKTRVLAELGLPEDTDPHVDHVVKPNVGVQDAARRVAAQLQQLQAGLANNVEPGQRWSKLQQARQSAESRLGTVSKTASTPLNMPASLASVATGSLFAYEMTSAKGLPIQATAMLFMPKTTAPTGGWPLVVFGHGTTGVGAQCAPSVTMNATGTWSYAALVAQLVANGLAVVAPDYEGLGSAELGVVPGHPYLDLRSAGQSMVLAAVAAKKQAGAQLSGAWAALGHSQGGHAALAAAQFAGLGSQVPPGLSYKGAVAVAPASNLQAAIAAYASVIGQATPSTYATAYEAVGGAGVYAAYLIKGSQSTPQPIAAPSLLGSNLLKIYDSSVSAKCLDDFITTIQADVGQYALTAGATPVNYPGVNYAAVNTATVGYRLAAAEPGQVKLPGQTLIIQGSADTTVLPPITQKLVGTMEGKGSQVTFKLIEDASATHSGVLYVTAAQAAMQLFLASLFSPSP